MFMSLTIAQQIVVDICVQVYCVAIVGALLWWLLRSRGNAGATDASHGVHIPHVVHREKCSRLCLRSLIFVIAERIIVVRPMCVLGWMQAKNRVGKSRKSCVRGAVRVCVKQPEFSKSQKAKVAR